MNPLTPPASVVEELIDMRCKALKLPGVLAAL